MRGVQSGLRWWIITIVVEHEHSLQKATCQRFGAVFMSVAPREIVGIALPTLGLKPLNALRHPPEGSTCGWYIWGGGEFEESEDFFQPLHAGHLIHYCPELLPYLGLGPGWRVLLAPEHEDVWFDSKLLNA